MGLLGRIFGRPCLGCVSRDREIARLDGTVGWLQQQLDQQNKRLVEIVAPQAIPRIAAAERVQAAAARLAAASRLAAVPLPVAPAAALPRKDEPDLTLPGFEPAVPPSFTVDEG